MCNILNTEEEKFSCDVLVLIAQCNAKSRGKYKKDSTYSLLHT